MSTACGRPQGGEGVLPMWTHVDRGEEGKKPDFFVDVINGPLHTSSRGPATLSGFPREPSEPDCINSSDAISAAETVLCIVGYREFASFLETNVRSTHSSC